MPDASIAERLLAWYDRHHRSLPWRVPPGAPEQPDPYRVWLSEVMLQQTTVAAVKGYFERFTERWPTVEALAAAPEEDVLATWAGLGYYARARNLHACAKAVAEKGGRFPDSEDALRALPGIGAYTAAAIAAIAFGRKATVVDGNVERVMARLHAVTDPLPGSKAELRMLAAQQTPDERPGDYAQAVMDLGATVCTPKSPTCGLCPLMDQCQARARDIAQSLPARLPKKAKPVRSGIAWVLHDGRGGVMTVRRPSEGLLGGMLALPSSNWTETGSSCADACPRQDIDWRSIGEVRHTFTHFHLILEVRVAEAPLAASMHQADAAAAMPTVFAKVISLARPALGWSSP